MKTLWITLLSAAGGFVAGLLLSELIGLVSVLIFNDPAGIKYLPVYLAALSGLAALVIDLARRSKTP